MLALTLAIITEEFPGENRARAIGTWAAIGGTGFGVGPVAGGVLLSFFGWSSVFWVNVPFAAAGWYWRSSESASRATHTLGVWIFQGSCSARSGCSV